MSTKAKFLAEIETYLRRSGMTPSRFGIAVMSDPKFVFTLRDGRNPWSDTMDLVRKWMKDNPPKKRARKAA